MGAKKLKPNDVSIRLYLAKAYFGLQDYERCMSILTDAMSIWPDDLLLRINLAFCLECYGKAILGEDNSKASVPVIMTKLDHASALANSASRLYEYINLRWASMSAAARSELSLSSCAPPNLSDEMNKVEQRQDYCLHLKEQARNLIIHFNKEERTIKARQDDVAKARDAEAKREADERTRNQHLEDSRMAEIQEQAVRLMTEAGDIQLGRNLEASKLDAISAPGAKSKPAKTARAAADVMLQDGKPGKKEKKESKKEKKDRKKKDKKDKKRKRDEDRSGDEKEDTAQFGDRGDAVS